MVKIQKKISTYSPYLFGISGILVVILIYFLITIFQNNEFVYPSLSSVFVSFGGFFYDLNKFVPLAYSFFRVLISVVISFIISLFLTFIFVLYKPLLNLFTPILYIFKVAPLAAITLYLFLILPSNGVNYVVTCMLLIPLFLEANINGINNINKDILDDLELNKANIFIKFFKIFIPMIFPYIIMSLFQGIGLAFKTTVMCEYLVLQENSLGFLIKIYKDSLNTSDLIGSILIIVFYVVIFELIIKIFKKYLFTKE